MIHHFRLTIVFYILLASLSLIQNVSAQLSEDAYISLITCRPGDEIFNTWGHTGIRVVDKENKIDHIFNYGMFSFNEPGFLRKFLRGKLLYWVDTENFDSFYYKYNLEKRSVIEQKLNYTESQKNKVFQALNNNLKPENRKYYYDFFFDNCATRPRDIILDNLSLETNIQEETDITFRNLLDKYILHQPWVDFGVDLIVGSLADRKSTFSDQMFLPELLYSQMGKISLGDKQLVASSKLIVDHESQIGTRKKSTIFKPFYLFLLLLILELYLFVKHRCHNTSKLIRNYDKLWYFIAGVSSLLITFMWFGTDHIATKNNLNLMWLNPIFLFLLFKENKWANLIAIACLILTLIGSTFYQDIHYVSIIAIIILLLKVTRKMSYKAQT